MSQRCHLRFSTWAFASTFVLAALPLACSSGGDSGGDDNGQGGDNAAGADGAGGAQSGGSGPAGGSSQGGAMTATGGAGGMASGTGGAGNDMGGSMSTGGMANNMGGSTSMGGMSANMGGMPAGEKMAVAEIKGIEGGTITGTVTFTQVGADVTVVYALENCPKGVHQTHIHAGTGCNSRDEQGMHWGGKRGEGIGSGPGQLTCGDDMKGTLTYTRKGDDTATNWTIGGPATTNIVGHPLIVHGLNSSQRHGCGVIQMK